MKTLAEMAMDWVKNGVAPHVPPKHIPKRFQAAEVYVRHSGTNSTPPPANRDGVPAFWLR